MLISSAGLFPLSEDSVHSTLRDVAVRAEVELVMIGVGRARIDRGRQEWNSYQGVSKTTLPSTSTVSVASALYSVCPLIVE